MDRTLQSIDDTLQMGRKYVAVQERRVERQRTIIAELEKNGHSEAAENATTLLAAMEDLLSRMRQDVAEAEQRWAERVTQNKTYQLGGVGES